MIFNANYFIALVFCILPMGLLVMFVDRQIKARRKAGCLPFHELPRRPAGETLRLKLDEMDIDFTGNLVLIFIIPSFGGMAWLSQPFHGLTATLIFMGVVAVSTGYCGWKILKLLRTKADYQLGYEGGTVCGRGVEPFNQPGF